MVVGTRVASFLVAVLVLSSGLGSAHGPIPPQPVEWVSGRVLVRLAPEVDLRDTEKRAGNLTADLAELNRRFGVVRADRVMPGYSSGALRALVASKSVAPRDLELMKRLDRWVLLETDPGADVEAMVAAYGALDEVEVAEPDYIARLVGSEPGSPSPSTRASQASSKLSWIPNDPDFGSQWGLDFIDAPEAWDITQGSPAQVIAIIDTGRRPRPPGPGGEDLGQRRRGAG